MSEEQFRFIGARFEELEKHMKVLAEQNLMTRECLSAEIQETNKRIDGLEASLGRFAVRVGERFDKLETETAETRQQLEVFRDDTQQRLKRIEGHLSLKSSPSSRTQPRATRSSLTKRLKKS
jgi:predicted  nucleic acid-binding Zn-ribbon protein